MSGQKKGFAQFLRPPSNSDAIAPTQASPRQGSPDATASNDAAPARPAVVRTQGEAAIPALPERVRQVTSTGRVRTYSATRALPGVTLRLTEERWEKLKMLSIQERRPIQDILGEAMDGFMRARGLPW